MASELALYRQNIAPQNSELPVLNFGFEMVVPNVRQRQANIISPTKSMWSAYTRRVKPGEIVENHGANLNTIRRMVATDSYVRTSLAKYVNSIFLRGYVNHTLNPEIEKYMKLRLQMIVDGMPDHNHLDDFYQQIARDLICYANVYLLKIRAEDQKKPKGLKPIKGVPLTKYVAKKEKKINQDPIATYEILNPASIHIIRNEEATVLRFEQWPINAKDRPTNEKEIRKWKPEEIIHIVMDREDGFAYGISSLDVIIDDVRLLRALEDSASRLAYRYAFPFTQVKVGIDKPGFTASDEDVQYYREMIQNAPSDATMVTNERVSFEIVGVQGEAIDLKPYLEHFEERVFSGLQVSDVAMGRGDTSNRNTADAMTVEMHDQIKHYQNIIGRNITSEIYRELLLEANYDWYDNPDKNWCELKFNEIEIEAQIKTETHIMGLVQGNMISISEGRDRMGLQPFKDKEWEDTYLMKVMLPQITVEKTGTVDLDEHGNLMKETHDATIKQMKLDHKGTQLDHQLAQKEIDTPPEQGDANHQTTTQTHAVTTGGGKRTVKKTLQVKKPMGPTPGPKSTAKGTNFKIRPANQHGRRSGPKRASEGEALDPVEIDLTLQVDRFHKELLDVYNDFSLSLLSEIQEHINNPASNQTIPSIISFIYGVSQIRFESLSDTYLMPAFALGWDAFEKAEGTIVPKDATGMDATVISRYNQATIRRLISDIGGQITNAMVKVSEDEDIYRTVQNIVDTSVYRLQFLATMEPVQAFWFGYATAALQAGRELVIVPEFDSTCETCLKKAGTKLTNSMSASVRMANVPSWHPACSCVLVPLLEEEDQEEE